MGASAGARVFTRVFFFVGSTFKRNHRCVNLHSWVGSLPTPASARVVVVSPCPAPVSAPECGCGHTTAGPARQSAGAKQRCSDTTQTQRSPQSCRQRWPRDDPRDDDDQRPTGVRVCGVKQWPAADGCAGVWCEAMARSGVGVVKHQRALETKCCSQEPEPKAERSEHRDTWRVELMGHIGNDAGKLVSQHETLQPRQAGRRSATMVLKSDFGTCLGVLKRTSSNGHDARQRHEVDPGRGTQCREGVGAVTVVGGSGWRGWGGERERVVRRTLRRNRPSLPCF